MQLGSQYSAVLAKLFAENYMKLNEDKCHRIFDNKCNDSVVTIGSSIIKESDYETLLGVAFDKKFSQIYDCRRFMQKGKPKLACTCSSL